MVYSEATLYLPVHRTTALSNLQHHVMASLSTTKYSFFGLSHCVEVRHRHTMQTAVVAMVVQTSSSCQYEQNSKQA
jgi:hypothetical protein